MTLGDIIKNYRECNNITIGEFASACSLSKGYISMLENNINPRNNKPISPTLPSMAKVASGMGIELDTLLKMLDGKQSVQLIEDNIDSIQVVPSSSQCKEIIEVCEQLSAHNQKKSSPTPRTCSPPSRWRKHSSLTPLMLLTRLRKKRNMRMIL